MGMIPKQTKATIRIIGTVGIYKLFGALIVMAFGDTLATALIPNDVMRLLFVTFAIIVYFILSSKSKNPNKYFITEMRDYLKYLFSQKIFVRNTDADKVKSFNIKEFESNEERERQLNEIISEQSNEVEESEKDIIFE